MSLSCLVYLAVVCGGVYCCVDLGLIHMSCLIWVLGKRVSGTLMV